MDEKNKKEPNRRDQVHSLEEYKEKRKNIFCIHGFLFHLKEASEDEIQKNPLDVIFNDYFKMKTGKAFFKGFVKPFFLGRWRDLK